jgi:multidrug efflux system outer membrane protein
MKPRDDMRRAGRLGLLVAFLAGCAVGPDYERPAVDAPAQYRTAESAQATPDVTHDLANLGWWDVFDDPQLFVYLADALANSWDIKIAAARVLQAAAAAGVVQSQFFPSIALGGDVALTRTSEVGPGAVPGGDNQFIVKNAFVSMSTYEIDLWGRIRRASESAWAQLLATEAARQTVRQTLVVQGAVAYLTLLQLDYEQEVVERSLVVRRGSLDLTTAREAGGVASLQDVVQSRVLVSSAEAALVDVLRRKEQQENALCILLGRNPGPIQRGAPLQEQVSRAEVPPGIPSELLERRPDIQTAEQFLVSANADIGEAKAAFFPQLTLTGAFGFQSVSLSSLFTSPAQVWQFGPTLTLPLFTGGRLTSEYEFAKARFQEAEAQYRQTVQNAFRDVSDALIQHQRSREFTVRQGEATQARRDAAELATIRYDGGVTSYLEVLFNEQELLDAELLLAQAIGQELISVVQVYRSLGGGWQAPDVTRVDEPNGNTDDIQETPQEAPRGP